MRLRHYRDDRDAGGGSHRFNHQKSSKFLTSLWRQRCQDGGVGGDAAQLVFSANSAFNFQEIVFAWILLLAQRLRDFVAGLDGTFVALLCLRCLQGSASTLPITFFFSRSSSPLTDVY